MHNLQLLFEDLIVGLEIVIILIVSINQNETVSNKNIDNDNLDNESYLYCTKEINFETMTTYDSHCTPANFQNKT